jgi:hypothetical protein
MVIYAVTMSAFVTTYTVEEQGEITCSVSRNNVQLHPVVAMTLRLPSNAVWMLIVARKRSALNKIIGGVTGCGGYL